MRVLEAVFGLSFFVCFLFFLMKRLQHILDNKVNKVGIQNGKYFSIIQFSFKTKTSLCGILRSQPV